MKHLQIIQLFAIMLLANIFLPVYAQAQATPPSKYSMKKDGDGDGVKNKRDKCLTTPPGVTVDGYGCPLDLDKDGVPDYLDKCPDLPGLAELNGCQDKDADGVSDSEDACPDVPGIGRFMGCPDSDGDGIEDKKDKCPNAKGLDRFQGCPDTDGDGVEDTKDKCPDTKSGVTVDFKGCPADSDMDGVLDINDKCPYTIAGVKVDETGCPADTDGDGVLNVFDKCPTVKGDASNNGCPAKVVKRMNFAIRKVNFDSKSGSVKASSYAMLDEVVAILKEYPDYSLRIGGHTDSYEKTPDVLSQSRVDAVKSYLLGKGVADSRITTSIYGKTRPVTSNANATLRAQNRRVELELYLR
ncbi:OmpA family protein [Ferruginibacter lapsinanis]|uniref:OmpA family protein n=1 Tax=Ferruginibacter lapsinanis TaxID=563172 RepID=UPI001E37540C|nr:OmpA family protein [Ferruginibacter lapsinanis]UEG50889.1 OmpA family protein [Ferruginibacter lapsinanis]